MFNQNTIVIFTLILTSNAFPIRVNLLGGCESTEFGCCPLSTTPCTDLDCMNCYLDPQFQDIGGCLGTQYGCCQDNQTICLTADCHNCYTKENTTVVVELGGCEGTEFGCCQDNQTICLDTICSNCYAHTVIIGGCNSTLRVL